MFRIAIKSLTALLSAGLCTIALAAGTSPTRVLLIGASIGQDWKLAQLPQRLPIRGYEFEAVQAWQFDKSEVLEEALMRPSRKFRPTLGYFKGFFRPSPKPADMFILKECSSYFPSDMARNRELVQRWVKEIRARGKPVIVTTTVPVTAARSAKDPGKQQALREFNDWLRSYAASEKLPLIDLEAALRTDETNRLLRDEFTSGDGSHLNPNAYAVLDRVMTSVLCRLDGAGACAAGVQSARAP